MKRYRVFGVDFDSRPYILSMEIKDEWEEAVKEVHRNNQEQQRQALLKEFGEYYAEQKKQNFIDLGSKPFSIIAFHNKFLEQVRNSFVVGGYYPALTGACALGERIILYCYYAMTFGAPPSTNVSTINLRSMIGIRQ